MATKKKQRTIKLFFETKEHAHKTCDILGLNKQKSAKLDRPKVNSNYSKTTGHFGQKPDPRGLLIVPLRYRISLGWDQYTSYDSDTINSLPVLDSNELWVAE